MASKLRIGIGYDVHPLVPGRKLVLGGIEVPFEKGLDGWSDADVLTHAIIEAILGAAASGDIGSHFPPGEPQYKGVSSLTLLETVKCEIIKKGWQIVNIDCTVVTEKPRLKEFFDPMRQRLSQVLGISINQINVKASTSEGLGSIGRGKGMASFAVALLEATSD